MPFCEQIRVIAVGLITRGNQILANRSYDPVKQQTFFRIPGGGVDFQEKAEDTVRREYAEELGLNVKVGKLLGVEEHIFEYSGKKGHEIAFLFEAFLPEQTFYQQESFPFIEAENAHRCAEWVEVSTANRIYPENFRKYLNILS